MENYKINVGGTHFEIPTNSLMKYPDSKLARLTKAAPNYDKRTDSFFFNRNPDFFNNILDLYRTDALHLPFSICSAIVRTELEFWDIPLDKLCQCCQHQYFKFERDMDVIKTLKDTFENDDLVYDPEELQKSKWKRVLNKIWLLTDQPKSSIYAKIFSVAFLAFVLMSIVSFILGSREEFRRLAAHFNDPNALMYMVHYSTYRYYNDLKEILLLYMCFLIASVIFASLIYYAEFHTPDTFPDIPRSIWWSIVTMTTVGYGDFYPKSGYGYVVGTLCAFCGVIILALPIAVVATNFNDFYEKNKERENRVKLNESLNGNQRKVTLPKHTIKVSPLVEEDL
ncbi:hypothetical protein FSP39_004756 [Pinctada imbricata]|uniref:KCNC1 n=1 Tax=Pinctada imbricata TaxID=66713 RepID=A0AA89BJZ7_PINIB|nr:hypothetical protein FSP39_004756 [Pinctada imbricata]